MARRKPTNKAKKPSIPANSKYHRQKICRQGRGGP